MCDLICSMFELVESTPVTGSGLRDFLSSLLCLSAGLEPFLGMRGLRSLHVQAPSCAAHTPTLFLPPHYRVLWTRSPLQCLDREGLHQRGGQDVPGSCRPHPWYREPAYLILTKCLITSAMAFWFSLFTLQSTWCCVQSLSWSRLCYYVTSTHKPPNRSGELMWTCDVTQWSSQFGPSLPWQPDPSHSLHPPHPSLFQVCCSSLRPALLQTTVGSLVNELSWESRSPSLLLFLWRTK